MAALAALAGFAFATQALLEQPSARAAGMLTLGVSVHGAGSGAVKSEPGGIECEGVCSPSFEEGTVVTLTASPGPGSVFAGWTGICSGAATVCQVLMDRAHDVSATFEVPPPPLTWQLAVGVRGEGSGTVASDPSGIDCGGSCSGHFEPGAVVTLTATPAPGSVFAGWGGVCSSLAEACQVLMDGAHDVSATFEPSPYQVLTVRVAGAGTVRSQPVGIVCDSSCSRRFGEKTTVRLTADPDPDHLFAGWGGACGGDGPCLVTMDAAHDVSARFEASPKPSPQPPAPPRTRILKASIDPRRGRASFRFLALGASSGFRCSLGQRGRPLRWRPCSSPRAYSGLRSGRYLFAVRAEGPGGADPTPARRAFAVR